MTTIQRLLLFVILLLAVRDVYGQDGTGKITYVAADAIYTDIGTLKGAVVGDSLRLAAKPAQPILVIRSISRKSSLVASFDSNFKAAVGMDLLFHPSVVRTDSIRITTGDSAKTARSDLQALWSGAIAKHNQTALDNLGSQSESSRSVSKDRNLLVGRVGLQFFSSSDRKNSDYNYYQPGMVVNLDYNRIQGSHYSVSTNTHIRKTYSNRDLRSANYPLRIYELSLKYQNDAVPYSYQVGRVSSPVINGIGYFDGALYAHKLQSHVTVGGFVGTEPDYRKSTPQTSTSKVGIYANYKHEFSNETRTNSTLAFSGQYVHGKIDREFFYLQNDATYGSLLYLYQNAEVGINRSGQSRRASQLELSNIYLMARIRPIRTLSMTGSYDARKNVFLIQTYRTIPDSLFDDAFRQGLRGEVSWRATKQLTLSVSSSVRTRAGDSQNTWLHSAGMYYYNFLQTQLNLNFRYFTTTTPYTSAHSFSYGVSRQWGRLYASSSLRTYTYELRGRSESYDRRSVSADVSYEISRRLFTTAQYEYSTGRDEQADRFFLEISYRF